MTIKEEKPLSISEVIESIKNSESATEVGNFLKGFCDTSIETALKIKEELTSLDILKLKEKDIVKIIDFMPEDATELNKIVGDSNLDAEEITKILDVINK